MFQATPRLAATRAIDILSTTMDSANITASRDSFPFDGAAALMSWRHTLRHGQHRYRGTTTSRIVGFQPNGTCANLRSTASCRTPRPAQPGHGDGGGSAAQHRVIGYDALGGH